MKKFNLIILASAIALSLMSLTAFSMSDESHTKKISMDKAGGIATFAGGCFWCMEKPFEKIKGVSKVISGYTGGHKKNPTYKEVSSGSTGHLEAVQIHFDPMKVSYKDLLEVLWRNINPTDAKGQFVDRGEQYATAIFVHDDMQNKLALQSKADMDKTGRFDKKIVTPILRAVEFFPAEEYHQDYYKKNPIRYNFYRFTSGRDQFIDKVWGDERDYKITKVSTMSPIYSKPSEDELKKQLTPLQYKVTQKDGTEPPFKNKYWDNKKSGIYVDIVSGEPLFSSIDKFESGTGWPSFTRPLVPEHIVEKKDEGFFMVRTEVRSKNGDTHLGHLFDDGPKPTGLRYCINSASLRFVHMDSLEGEGYGEFLGLFKSKEKTM